MRRKIESSSSKLSKNRCNWIGKDKHFSKPTGKEDKWTILLCVGGKNRAPDPNFREKTAKLFRSFETALSSLDFVYRKLQQTPPNPPKNDEICHSQLKPGKVSRFLLFYSQKVTVYFITRFYPSFLLNSIQCLT